jgi:hypothetical protein
LLEPTKLAESLVAQGGRGLSAVAFDGERRLYATSLNGKRRRRAALARPSPSALR